MRAKIAEFPLEASDLPKGLVDKKSRKLAWKTSRYVLWNLPIWERDDGRRCIVQSVVDTLAKDLNIPHCHLDHIKNVELYPLLSSWKAHENDTAHVTELKKRLILYLVGLLLYSPNLLLFEWAELKTALDDEELATRASSSDRTKEQLLTAVEGILTDSNELSYSTDQGDRYRERWAISEFLYGYNWYLRGTEAKLDDAGKDVLEFVQNVKLNHAPEQQHGTREDEQQQSTWEDSLCDHPLPPLLQGKAEKKTSKSRTRSSRTRSDHKHYRMKRAWCGMRNGELLSIIRAKYALCVATSLIPRDGKRPAKNKSAAVDAYVKAVDTLVKGPFDQGILTHIARYPFEGSTGNTYLDTLYGLQEQLWDASEQERMWTMLDTIGPQLCESCLDGLVVWKSAPKRRKLEKKLRKAFGVPTLPFPTDIASCSTTMRDVTYALVYDPNSVLARMGGFAGEITAKDNGNDDDTIYGNLNPGDLLITWDDPSCVTVPEEHALPNSALYISHADARKLAHAVANEYGNQSAQPPVVVALLGRTPIDCSQVYCTQEQWGEPLPDCSNKLYGGSLNDKLRDVLVRTYRRDNLPGKKTILTGPEAQSIYDHRACLDKKRTNEQGKESSPISRIHAAIVYQEDEKGRGTYSYVDLGSKNGALWTPPDPKANSQPIKQRGDSVPLEDQGTLQLGSSEAIKITSHRSIRTLIASVQIGQEDSGPEA